MQPIIWGVRAFYLDTARSQVQKEDYIEPGKVHLAEELDLMKTRTKSSTRRYRRGLAKDKEYMAEFPLWNGNASCVASCHGNAPNTGFVCAPFNEFPNAGSVCVADYVPPERMNHFIFKHHSCVLCELPIAERPSQGNLVCWLSTVACYRDSLGEE